MLCDSAGDGAYMANNKATRIAGGTDFLFYFKLLFIIYDWMLFPSAFDKALLIIVPSTQQNEASVRP